MEKLSAKVASKLLQVKEKVPYLQKNAQGHQYNYASPSQVLAAINPLLNEAKLILVTEVVNVLTEQVFSKPKVHKIFVGGKPEEQIKDLNETMFHVSFIMRWVCTETGESISIPWFASGVNGDEKGLGSALTYAERYFILKQFNIATDMDDPDSFQEKHMSEEEKQKREQQAQEELNRRIEQVAMKILECKSGDEVKAISANNQDIWKVDKIVAARKLVSEQLGLKTGEKPNPNGNNQPAK